MPRRVPNNDPILLSALAIGLLGARRAHRAHFRQVLNDTVRKPQAMCQEHASAKGEPML
jgi:hypothetical protein